MTSHLLYSNYVALVNSLDDETKRSLLLVLAKSLQPTIEQDEALPFRKSTSSYLELFGSWQSVESADEIIDTVYTSRLDRTPSEPLFD